MFNFFASNRMRKIKVILILLSALFIKGNAIAQLLDSLSLDTITATTSIESGLKNKDLVVKLVLRKQKFKEFPLEILEFKNLQYLDLSKNSLKELPAEIATLSNLQYLIVNKNNLNILTPEIGKLKNLKVLYLNQNNLDALPPQIGDLEKLEYLDVWDNNLSIFPEELNKLKKLKYLDLRAILINKQEQNRIQSLLPQTKIMFSPDCKCGM